MAFASAGDMGKSSIACYLAAKCITDGKAFDWNIRRGKCLIVAYEDSPAFIENKVIDAIRNTSDYKEDKIRKIMKRKLIIPQPLNMFRGSNNDSDSLEMDEGFIAFRHLLREHKPKLVIVDPFGSTGLDVMSNSQGRKVINWFREIAPEIKCGILIVAHSTKSERDAATDTNRTGSGVISGSASIYDSLRTVFTLNVVGKTNLAGIDYREPGRDGDYGSVINYQKSDKYQKTSGPGSLGNYHKHPLYGIFELKLVKSNRMARGLRMNLCRHHNGTNFEVWRDEPSVIHIDNFKNGDPNFLCHVDNQGSNTFIKELIVEGKPVNVLDYRDQYVESLLQGNGWGKEDKKDKEYYDG